jgi:iron complex outermembrane receptor protein
MHRYTGALRATFFFLFSWSVGVGAVRAEDSAVGEATVDEVIVTAQLRDGSLADLAASATVLDAKTLEATGVSHLEDVLALVPNLNWSAGTSRPRYFQLRGIGELESWQGAPNPSVGFLIDGIDFSGIGMPATLLDVDRIEVLRGPQGTSYGANALAGLIAVNTRAPSREVEFNGNATMGDHGTFGATAVAGGPVGAGESAWRFSAGRFKSDGFRRNTFLGRDDTNGYDESTARVRFAARPLDNLVVDFTALWADLDNGYDAFSIDNSRVTLSDKPGRDAQIARAGALRLTYSLDSVDITSRTAWARSDSDYSFDADWGNDAAWGVNAPYDWFQEFLRDRRTLTEDLRITSRESVDTGAAFSWLAGAYLLDQSEAFEQHDIWNDAFLSTGDVRFTSRFEATNIAAYGQLDWRIASRTVLALGARGERRSATYADSNAERYSPDETMAGGSLTLRQELNDAVQAYASLSRGYKAGGFNIGGDLPETLRYYDAETLHSLELGLRGSSETLTGDAALFYMRRDDQQVHTGEQLVQGDPSTFVQYLGNAARGENYGLEATLRWRPVPALLIDLRAALLETRFLDYTNASGTDLDGREQAHAPQYQFDFGAEWRPAGGFFARIDFAGMDDFYFSTSHEERAPARVLTHVKMGYSSDRWRAEVWVRNLFDEYYSQRGFRFGNEPPDFTSTRYVQAGDPRHAGVTVAYSFK